MVFALAMPKPNTVSLVQVGRVEISRGKGLGVWKNWEVTNCLYNVTYDLSMDAEMCDLE